ncbi:cysteine desulfurase family protein [Sphingobium sp. CR2-8]|uniref:cysteine desulfurase family protein n=1 Tax=Sphingobium sp. CR2-8 TaxID=1306534 RepID=UPI002DBF151D|nr:cysteine desulfurase family protein [Sphingobium sp. CR2-8]MEC3912952.1 cysteine desulfurase family protein [Sphingobium sp. CR2-8]
MDEPAYFDGFATTPLAPEARDAMVLASSRPGNAGSPHLSGARASAVLEKARQEVASLIGADASELVFTSGATELDNLAIRGVAFRALQSGNPRRKIVVSSIEHKAVLEAADSLSNLGFNIVRAPVTSDGVIDLEAAQRVINSDTLLVSAMLANNETGAIQPVARIAAMARVQGALMHCDAAQAVGKIPVDVDALDVNYMSLSSHKMYGPMGVGALYVANGAPKPSPVQFGGGQERAMRPGTEPVYLIAGFGAAATLAWQRLENDMAHGHTLATVFKSELSAQGIGFRIGTGNAQTLPGSLSISISGCAADEIVSRLAPYASVSTGSACTSGQVMPSHVLLAMGNTPRDAGSVIRIFFGRYNTPYEIEKFLPHFIAAVTH